MNDLPNHRSVPYGWLRLAEVAALCQRSDETVRGWVERGYLRGEPHRLGGYVKMLIPASEIERLRLDAETLTDTQASVHLGCCPNVVRSLERPGWLTRLPPLGRAQARYLQSEVMALTGRLDATGLPMPPDCVTYREAADIIGVSETTVERLGQRGQLLPVGVVKGVRVYRQTDCERLGEDYPRWGLSRLLVRSIVRRVQAGELVEAVAAELGISRARAQDIVRGHTWAYETRDLRAVKRRAAA